MDDKQPDQQSPLTTTSFAPVRGVPDQRPVVDPVLQRRTLRGTAWIVSLFLVPIPVMLALGILARHGVPVPPLGYWDTLAVLATMQMVLSWDRWTR